VNVTNDHMSSTKGKVTRGLTCSWPTLPPSWRTRATAVAISAASRSRRLSSYTLIVMYDPYWQCTNDGWSHACWRVTTKVRHHQERQDSQRWSREWYAQHHVST